jgi:hypothetical protein
MKLIVKKPKLKILISIQGAVAFRMDVDYDPIYWKRIEKKFIEIKGTINSNILFKTRKWCGYVKSLGLPAPTKVYVRDKNKLELEWHYGSSFMLVCVSSDFRNYPDGYTDPTIFSQ